MGIVLLSLGILFVGAFFLLIGIVCELYSSFQFAKKLSINREKSSVETVKSLERISEMYQRLGVSLQDKT